MECYILTERNPQVQFRQKQQQRGNWGKTSCVWLLDLWLRPVSLLWPGELCEFSRKCLILCVQGEENNPVEQVSEAAKSDRPKSITVCIHFHLTRSHRQIFGQGFPCYFTAPSANAVEKKRKLRKTEGRVPSRVDSCDSSICCHKPGHNPIPENMERKKKKTQRPIKHRTHWKKSACELWHRAADVTQMVLCPQSLVSICPNVKQIPCGLCVSVRSDYFRQVDIPWKETHCCN